MPWYLAIIHQTAQATGFDPEWVLVAAEVLPILGAIAAVWVRMEVASAKHSVRIRVLEREMQEARKDVKAMAAHHGSCPMHPYAQPPVSEEGG